MKTINKIIIALTGIAFVACSDFLDTQSPSYDSDWLTKPDYGSMQEQCMGLKEKDSCAGISPAHVLHWQKD